VQAPGLTAGPQSGDTGRLSPRIKKRVSRESVFAFVIVLLLLPRAAVGQHSGRHASTTPASTGATPEPESPDVVTLEHSVAMQARPDQREEFREAVKSTASACAQAQALPQPAAAPDPPDLNQAAIRLQDAVEDAQSDNRKFLRSLSDVQVSGLKKQIAAVVKANAAVTKEYNALLARLDKLPVDSARLLATVSQLEKALTRFQAAQLRLGQEIGIPPH
jgi:hypothetical protein